MTIDAAAAQLVCTSEVNGVRETIRVRFFQRRNRHWHGKRHIVDIVTCRDKKDEYAREVAIAPESNDEHLVA